MFPLRDDRPTYTAPIVTVLLIAACVLVFFFELSLDEYSRDYFINLYGVVPAHLRPSALMTSLFIHGGWAHIIGNMLFLWAFGRSLEDGMGHVKFLIFYLISGLAAGIAFALFNPGSTLPTVGASGAIAGVMGGYLVKFPRARVVTLVPIFFFLTTVDIPAAFLLLYWFAMQFFNGVGSVGDSQASRGDVAWFAHIGGFLAGMGLVMLLAPRQPRYQQWQ